jgi:DNA repair protein RecN (Recombination protein N)
MVEHLSVRNFAIIETAEVDLPPGLVVFTGETGAGKSLIVGALSFVFGARLDSNLLREGAAECSVTATMFTGNNSKASSWLHEHEIEPEDGRVLLRRGLKSGGRSYAYIQERQVTRNELQEFTGFLADIHGQHEHQRLLDPNMHLEMLDEFASLASLKAEYRAKYESWIASLKDYRTRAAEAEKSAREMDALAFSVNEIKGAKLKRGEDEELTADEKKITQHEKLFRELSDASSRLSASVEGGVGQIRHAINNLDAVKGIDAILVEWRARLEQAYLEVEDIGSSISTYLLDLRFDPARLEEVETRLAELRRLKKKYGPTLDDVMARMEHDKRMLEDNSSWDVDKIKLENTISVLRKETLLLAEKLSERRKSAAAAFSGEVEVILKKLGMDHAQLPVSIEKTSSAEGKLMLSSTGMDRVELLISPNLGEAPKPLVKIASGGELSRVALAIKAVTASRENATTLVFDEIDSGIGGEVGVSVGKYLKVISHNKQVFCVTHLASIAVKADTHVVVSKHVEKGRTLTKVEELSGESREVEVARMLAGDKDRDASRLHAAEMLKASFES